MQKGDYPDRELNVIEIVRELTERRKLAEQLLEQVRTVKKSRGVNRTKEIARLEKSILMMDDPCMHSKLIENSVKEACCGFLEKWHATFPDHTENECLLAAFFREGLSNSDIAELKGIDTRSVAVSRHRLKAKLGLGPEDDLDDFIQSF